MAVRWPASRVSPRLFGKRTIGAKKESAPTALNIPATVAQRTWRQVPLPDRLANELRLGRRAVLLQCLHIPAIPSAAPKAMR
jgi:hypothetical protein